MAGLTALDRVNPYLSERRVLIMTQLAQVLANTLDTLASNSPATGAKFKEWTGHSQSSLEAAWAGQGFTKGDNGSWTREGAGAVTTSCEGLVGTVFSKIEAAGLGKRKGGATSFNLAGNKVPTGKESPTPPVGWHWYRDKKPGDGPRPGDVFQIGTEVAAGQWSHAHVGVISRWDENDGHPMWETVEAGQGGPVRGYDFMQRKAYRLVFPIDSKKPLKTLMGWLDIDEHFG